MSSPLLPLLGALAPAVIGWGSLSPVLAQAVRPELVPSETPVADLVSSAALLLEPAPAGAVGVLPPFLLYPLPDAAAEQDPYGWRWSERRQAWRMHAGLDLIAPEGTPVLAMAPGRVLLVDVIEGYGLTVLLDHGGGWQTLYAHLLDSAIERGQLVRAGEPLGRVGRSGSATTDHLHVELRRRLPAERAAAAPAGAVVAVDLTGLLADAQQRLPVQQAQGVSRALP